MINTITFLTNNTTSLFKKSVFKKTHMDTDLGWEWVWLIIPLVIEPA